MCQKNDAIVRHLLVKNQHGKGAVFWAFRQRGLCDPSGGGGATLRCRSSRRSAPGNHGFLIACAFWLVRSFHRRHYNLYYTNISMFEPWEAAVGKFCGVSVSACSRSVASRTVVLRHPTKLTCCRLTVIPTLSTPSEPSPRKACASAFGRGEYNDRILKQRALASRPPHNFLFFHGKSR